MAKHGETFEHTADVGLAARADSLPELLEALADTLADFICTRAGVRERQAHPLAVAAEDVEALTVDFLHDVLLAIQTDRFAVARTQVTAADEHSATATLHGEPYDPARHEYGSEVKAITYHQLHVARNDAGQWEARVIIDV